MFLPEQDRYSFSKRRLNSQISSLFGGRIAEEMIFGADAVTTGASNDIERATEIARNMVTKWGLSERLGPLTYSEEDGEVFLGRSVTQHKMVSDETAHIIDEEIPGYYRPEFEIDTIMEIRRLWREAANQQEKSVYGLELDYLLRQTKSDSHQSDKRPNQSH